MATTLASSTGVALPADIRPGIGSCAPREGGVYRLTCLPTGWTYIGGTINFPGRWAQHTATANSGKHSNRVLQEDWMRFGWNAFEFGVVEALYSFRDIANLPMSERQSIRWAAQDWIFAREAEWLSTFLAAGPCYNTYQPVGPHFSPERIAQAMPGSLSAWMTFLSQHAHFGYTHRTKRACHVSVLLVQSKRPLLDGLQSQFGGVVLGPYRLPRTEVCTWKLRLGELPPFIRLLDELLPAGRKREQFVAWRTTYQPWPNRSEESSESA